MNMTLLIVLAAVISTAVPIAEAAAPFMGPQGTNAGTQTAEAAARAYIRVGDAADDEEPQVREILLAQAVEQDISTGKDTKMPTESEQQPASDRVLKQPDEAVLSVPVNQDQKATDERSQSAPVDQHKKVSDANQNDAQAADAGTRVARLRQQLSDLFLSPHVDLRFKFGSAAGLSTFTLYETEHSGNGATSENIQLEAILGPHSPSKPGPILAAGLFKRRHSGNAEVNALPASIDYQVEGASLGAGVGMRANDNVHLEGRLEIGLGKGQPTFTSPGVVWNQSKSGGYWEYSLILGGYYTFITGYQLGLELGAQSFYGNFSILNNSSQWVDAKVSGSTSTANLIFGRRF